MSDYLIRKPHTETWNDHWAEEGFPSPYQPFPKFPYVCDLLEILEAEPIVWPTMVGGDCRIEVMRGISNFWDRISEAVSGWRGWSH